MDKLPFRRGGFYRLVYDGPSDILLVTQSRLENMLKVERSLQINDLLENTRNPALKIAYFDSTSSLIRKREYKLNNTEECNPNF